MRHGLLALTLIALPAIVEVPHSEPGSRTVLEQRVPDAGIQPRVAVDRSGVAHLVYFRGEAGAGDLFYARSTGAASRFSAPVRVNHVPGRAIATGTVRGAQVAIGKGDRVHIAWNGVPPADPDATTPMFYTRLADGGAAFETERSVMTDAYNIDGGGAVAADRDGKVFVAWHANAPGEREEGQRRVWIARSSDEGRTFEREVPASAKALGACGCCGLGAFADSRGTLFILYRSAQELVNRDIYLLTSRDSGARFDAALIDRWKVGACVMSTQAFAEGPGAIWTAWETTGQIHLGRIDPRTGTLSRIAEAPGPNRARKHPSLAVNADGDVLLAWTENTAWSRGGDAAWQQFDAAGRPKGPSGRAAGGIPTWSLVAAYTRPDGSFAVVY
jgi:hypothetical protein